MEKLIEETEMMANVYFKDFGFNEDQIDTLITQGKKDIYKAVAKLELLLNSGTEPLEEINNVLHALKGLFFQLGNHKLAEQLGEINEDDRVTDRLKDISKLFFIQSNISVS